MSTGRIRRRRGPSCWVNAVRHASPSPALARAMHGRVYGCADDQGKDAMAVGGGAGCGWRHRRRSHVRASAAGADLQSIAERAARLLCPRSPASWGRRFSDFAGGGRLPSLRASAELHRSLRSFHQACGGGWRDACVRRGRPCDRPRPGRRGAAGTGRRRTGSAVLGWMPDLGRRRGLPAWRHAGFLRQPLLGAGTHDRDRWRLAALVLAVLVLDLFFSACRDGRA